MTQPAPDRGSDRDPDPAPDPDPDGPPPVRSRGLRVTVDGGRESFFGLSIERTDSDAAWIVSDTVRSLENAR